ncbi:MAG: DeoR/GlpR family DNA-binding transcription regulator [Pirellulales bacterium]
MKTNRQDEILRCIAEVGTLSVEEAATRLEASAATIRRDFNQLAEANLVERVRGGIRIVGDQQMVPFAVREVRQPTEKMAIAEEAATLLAPGDVVFIDGGTTTLQLASCLPPMPLRIITNSLRLAAAIESRAMKRGLWEVFLTGGFLYSGSGLLVGPSAQTGLSQYHADWAMLSASSVSTQGVFNDNEHVVESERLMIANADKVAVLADNTKIGRYAMCHIAGIDKVDVLVTDDHVNSKAQLDEFVSAGVDVLRVGLK